MEMETTMQWGFQWGLGGIPLHVGMRSASLSASPLGRILGPCMNEGIAPETIKAMC